MLLRSELRNHQIKQTQQVIKVTEKSEKIPQRKSSRIVALKLKINPECKFCCNNNKKKTI